MRHLALALPVVLLLSACFPKSAVPPGPLSPEQIAREQSLRPAVSADELEQGRKLFITECGRCHDHPDIQAIPLDRWPDIVGRMVGRTKLYAGARPMLMQFVEAVHN